MSTFSLSSSFKDKIRFKRVEEQTAKEKVKIRSGGGGNKLCDDKIYRNVTFGRL